jgi:pimeloyl-ACP methyl ester carboxylesterase
MTSTAATIEADPIRISDDDLADLHRRLAQTRWPDRETVDDWSQGIPLAYVQELCRYWREDYDWRNTESALAQLPQYRTTIDGLGIHYIHARSPEPDARPLVLTHGWPGSILEFRKVIAALADPVAHGGQASDAFHVVCPSLPGYGFSDRPTRVGRNIAHIAGIWVQLMQRLGYPRFLAQGGDWGSFISTELARSFPQHLEGIHLNFAVLSPAALRNLGELTPSEDRTIEGLRAFRDSGSAYSLQQATRPQTIGYGLADSPAAQCAWIVEKMTEWSDCDGHPENAFTRDELLDNVMMYWLSNTGASSGRLYWESFRSSVATRDVITVPTAYSAFPHEVACYSERWVSTRYVDLRYYHEVSAGGHFAAYEQPQLFVDEIRAAFRAIPR